jgi:hypothetical protein
MLNNYSGAFSDSSAFFASAAFLAQASHFFSAVHLSHFFVAVQHLNPL